MAKYLTRYPNKNKREDLEKLKHYAQLGSELEPENFAMGYSDDCIQEICKRYAQAHEFGELKCKILLGIVYQKWEEVISDTELLISEEYGAI